MAEFSLANDEFTNDALTDGSVHTVTSKVGNVTIGRFGVFSYYQFRTSSSAVYHCRISAQPKPEIRLIFVSKGQDIHIGWNGETNVFSVGESNCCLVTEGCTQEMAFHAKGDSELVILAVRLSDVSLPIKDGQHYLRNFLEADTCTWLLDGCNMQFGMRKMTVIQQVLHEKKPAYLQAIYTQVKLTELFVLFLEKAGRLGSRDSLAQLRQEELERVRKVRNMLHDYPERTYSLVGLAHAVGTNETSLKNNFKAVYGTTVFGYLTACRMERAKALLENKKLKVALVAQEVGYKYASHFSVAFRKYFGYLPTKLLRIFVSFPAYLSELESAEAFSCLAIL